MEFTKIGRALQVAANNAAAVLAACEAAGVTPTARKKPGRKPKAVKPSKRSAPEDNE